MANVINIMQDPDTRLPTYMKHANANDNTLRFVCHPADKKDNAIPFVLVFETDFSKIAKTGAITYISKKVGNSNREQVEVLLKKKGDRPEKPESYKYTIVMDGRTWDPRIVPN